MSRHTLVHRLLKADRRCQSCRVTLDPNVRNHAPYLISSMDGPRLVCRTCERAGCILEPTPCPVHCTNEIAPDEPTYSNVDTAVIAEPNHLELIDSLMEAIA